VQRQKKESRGNSLLASDSLMVLEISSSKQEEVTLPLAIRKFDQQQKKEDEDGTDQ